MLCGTMSATRLSVSTMLAVFLAAASCGGPQARSQASRTSSLVFWAQRGDIARADKALAEGADINGLDYSHVSALAAAVKGRQEKMVAHLLTAGARVDGATGQKVRPICQAAWDGSEKIVDLLLAHKPTLDVNDCQNNLSPLTTAIVRNYPNVVRQLVSAGASVSFVDGNGRLPLRQAIVSKKGPAAAILIGAGADASQLRWREVLAAYGHASTFYQQFVERLPANVQPTEPLLQRIAADLYNAGNDRLRSVLRDDTDLINAVVKAGLDPNATGPDGVTALEIAWRNHQPDALWLLVYHRAKGAQAQVSKLMVEMGQANASKEVMQAHLKIDPYLGPYLRPGSGTSKDHVLKLFLFYSVSRSVCAAILNRAAQVERDFSRLKK
jgi:ankyrin repeat protein